MTSYYTSDTHFNHENIIKYCSRPFDSISHMNAEIIKRWNDRITPEDTVYHLGDFSMGKEWRKNATQFRQQLNGRIILIAGNHDKSPDVMLQCGFDEVYNEFVIEIGTGKVLLRHAPGEGHDAGPVPDGYEYLLHGHVHTKWKRRGNLINVGCDVWDFVPRTMEEILFQ